MKKVMLKVAEISKSFGGFTALRNIAFEVRPGEVLGLIGPNGSGKTTLMESVSGLLPTDTGKVFWESYELVPSARKKHIFYLPDGVVPYEDQPVSRVLNYFAEQFEVSSSVRSAALSRLGLSAVLGKRAGALSKGFRRRLLLAIALMSPQPILFLDEPFDGFDLKQTLGVMEILRDVKKQGRTLFLSIHQLKDAERMCERLLLLSAGQIIGAGTLSELRAQARLQSGDLEEVFLALT